MAARRAAAARMRNFILKKYGSVKKGILQGNTGSSLVHIKDRITSDNVGKVLMLSPVGERPLLVVPLPVPVAFFLVKSDGELMVST